MTQTRLWHALTDPDALARGFGAKAISVPNDPKAEGAIWEAHFARRGFPDTVPMLLERYRPSKHFQISGTARHLLARLGICLEPHSEMTKVTLSLELSAQGIRGRILLKSASLTAQNLDARFKAHVRKFIGEIEAQEEKKASSATI